MKLFFAPNGHIHGCECAGKYASSLCACSCEIRSLWHAFVASLLGTIIEIVYSFISNSRSLGVDGLHIGNDTLSVGALIFLYHNLRKERESIATFIIFFLLLTSGTIGLLGAVERAFTLGETSISGEKALGAASLGLLLNMYAYQMLKSTSKAAGEAKRVTLLHFSFDIATSFLVIIVALINLTPHVLLGHYADLFASVVIALWMIVVSIQAISGKKHTH